VVSCGHVQTARGCPVFFDIANDVDERLYAQLMIALDASDWARTKVSDYKDVLEKILQDKVDWEELRSLHDRGLVDMESNLIPASARVELTKLGVAVLINAAPRMLDRVVANYEMPEATLAALVPLLDLRQVPAADRCVSTADNQELFSSLAKELETIRNELVKDQNANELPIPVNEKRAIAAELEGLVGQIKAGYVRLSDLTHRARPIVKNIADTCKDFAVIAGAAWGAIEVVRKILAAIF